MKELSIFIDESGDFGEYHHKSPYYIIAMVMHDQSVDISEEISSFRTVLSNFGFQNHCVHSGPIIRKEKDYKNVDIQIRRKILMAMMNFVRHIDINCNTVYIEKKHISDEVAVAAELSKQLATFIRSNYEKLLSYDIIKVYYDNGQIEVNKILASVFNTLLSNVEFRKVMPADYLLFQVADFVATLKLTELKLEKHILSKSELAFFCNERVLKKNYLKPMHKKE